LTSNEVDKLRMSGYRDITAHAERYRELTAHAEPVEA
jgi:hypothetical protein